MGTKRYDSDDDDGNGAAILLYLGWMFVLFKYFFVEVLLIGSIISLLGVPWVYGAAAWDVMRPAGPIEWRDGFWVVIWVLLALIYVDFLVALFAFMNTWDSVVIKYGGPVLRRISQAPVYAQLNAFAPEFSGPGGTWISLLIKVALKAAPIVPLMLITRGLETDRKDGTEPAFRQYFFGPGATDALNLSKNAAIWVIERYQGAFGWFAEKMKNSNDFASGMGFLALLFWPLLLALALALLLLGLVAAVVLILMLLIHGLAVGILVAIAAVIALLLFLIERSILLVRSGYAKCPHSGCHEKVPLPVYRCPQCGAMHRRLVPGRCGVFKRVCECGQVLPTFSWFGKQKLDAFCPHCRESMHEALFRANLHIPIFGGPSAGKTMFMIAGTMSLVEGFRPDLEADFIDHDQRRDYDARWKPDFNQGRTASKTSDRLPDAYLLSLRRNAGLPVSLYLFDPAGEVLENEQDLQRQRYLRHLGGLAILVDPLSFSSLAEAHLAEGGTLPSTRSTAPPAEIIERILSGLESHAGLSRTQAFRRRVAVVFTKGDLPIVQHQLGIRLSESNDSAPWGRPDNQDSERIRGWLQDNEPDFLHRLETHFGNLHFFLTSAMGHDGSSHRTFHPKRVLEPILWLLSAHAALTRPILARWSMIAAEIAVVAGLITLFAAVPLTGIRASLGPTEPTDRVIIQPPPPSLGPENGKPEGDDRIEPKSGGGTDGLTNDQIPPENGSTPFAVTVPTKFATVTSPDGANLHRWPIKHAWAIVTAVPHGTKLRVLVEEGDWCQIESLWIHYSAVEITDSEPAPIGSLKPTKFTTVTPRSDAHLRSRPIQATETRVAVAKPGNKLRVSGKQGDWYRIEPLWIHHSVVEITEQEDGIIQHRQLIDP